MKLLSYHIENYGKIHDKDGDFSENLTCICEKNGFGKSTLASFIKAMFYGLDSYTAASKGFNDRQRFYPFEGGKFGGNLTFESGGKTYRIERFFDKKSGKGDECRVYENGAPFEGFGEGIGKALFGLDEESFKKTVFITADEIEISSTHSINEKLNCTVEGVDETNDFDAAIDALEKAKKDLKAARGAGGRINQKKAEIAELTAQIKNLNDTSNSLSEEYAARERLSQEIASLDAELKTAGERALILQKWEAFDSLFLQKNAKENSLQALKNKYPLGLPSEAERVDLTESWQKTNLLRGSLQTVSFREDKEEALRKFEGKFKNGTPRDEIIAENQAKINRLSALKAERDRLRLQEKTEKEKLLENKFAAGLPSENELKEKRTLLEEYKRKDEAWKTLSASLLQAKTEPARTRTNIKAYWFILATVLLCAGAGLLFVMQALGIGLLIAGGVFLAIGLLSRSVNAPLPPSNGNLDAASLQAECKLLEEKLRAFTVPYGYYGEAGVVYDFSMLEEDIKAYRAFLSSKEEKERAIERLETQAEALQREIFNFLQSYGEGSEDLQGGLRRLTASIASYRALEADRLAAKAQESELLKGMESAQARVLEIVKKYALDESAATMDGLKALELDAKAVLELTREIALLEEKLLHYKESNGLTERPEKEGADTGALHARLSKLRKDLADCDKRIAESERDVEKLPDMENALLLAKEKLQEYNDKYDLYADTMDALKAAEQSLKDKYIAPIKERFSAYAAVLEKVLDEKIRMDQDFRIVFERGGESRSDKHLSAGERSLCALCLRLALIDNMYEAEQPFIVMDDPFVHLDEGHMARTKTLVSELAKGKQIVYFCCHESRRI